MMAKMTDPKNQLLRQSYSALIAMKILPDETTLNAYKDILDLMQMDYRIFHMQLPIFRDANMSSSLISFLARLLVPSEIEKRLGAGGKEISAAKRTDLANIKKLAVHARFAFKKAEAISRNVFEYIEYFDDRDWHVYEKETKILKLPFLAQMQKYLSQTYYIYRQLSLALQLNLVLRDPSISLDENLPPIVSQIEKANYGPYILFLFNGNLKCAPGLRKILQQIIDARNKQIKSRPAPRELPKGVIDDSELKCKSGPFPSEIYYTDLMYDVWSNKFVAQYSPDLLDTIAHVERDIMSLIRSEAFKKYNNDDEHGNDYPILIAIDQAVGGVSIKREEFLYEPSKIARDFTEVVLMLAPREK